MFKPVALALCLAVPSVAFAADNPPNSYKITYDGGSLTTMKAGDGARLVIEPKRVVILKNKGDEPVQVIPAESVTEISYGQDVHRRIGTAIGLAVISLGIGALMAFSKSKKHYIGLTWATPDGTKGGFAMQCDKNEYRGELAALEGITGKKAVNSDAMTVKN